MDYIVVSDLLIFANHGVFQEEKTLGQKFYLDLKLGLSTQRAALSNDLTASVHYGELAQHITTLFQQQSYDLIETCAEKIAHFILSTYPIVDEAHVRVKKPWAPITLPVESVYVDIVRKRHRAFLSLGSNIGDSQALLETAIQKLNNTYIKVTKLSSLYRTKAWGLTDQPDFLNQVIEIETFYEPQTLLQHLQNIELELGRERHIHWGPRTIDIDILFYDNQIIYESNLIVPHPYIQERTFVLEPMCDIAPHYIHPILQKPIRNLFDTLKTDTTSQ
ncbi:2-amino-4-hydroxy-6-hydroxymethyldihydropteridine diphosphokinase [Carnobacteriaceae bacterium zg-ZUI78]|nr:2-amino-4-hydroxy-6-hydroxymethyldihydropteridine diphosphokinase [Carnobacteriaceae bacterium zg-ZUI78]